MLVHTKYRVDNCIEENEKTRETAAKRTAWALMHKKGSSPSSTPAAKESVVSRQPCPNHGSAPAPQAACVPPPRNSRCQDCLFFPRQLYTYSVPFIESLVLTAWMMMLMLMIVVVMIRTPLHPLMEYAVYVLTSAACVSLGNTQAQS